MKIKLTGLAQHSANSKAILQTGNMETCLPVYTAVFREGTIDLHGFSEKL